MNYGIEDGLGTGLKCMSIGDYRRLGIGVGGGGGRGIEKVGGVI